MTLVVYKYINCFLDRLLALPLVTNYTTNYRIIVIITKIIILIVPRDEEILG